MPKYTTGEIAKLCNVSVRTVQYYDTRGILTPSELTEGGRRLYSEDDLRRLRIICFLRDTDISINSIGKVLEEENPGEIISILIDQQEQVLQEEIAQRQDKLEKLVGIRKGLKDLEHVSLESIGDIAHVMQSKKKLKKLYAIMLSTGIPFSIMQWVCLYYGIAVGIWWPLLSYLVAIIPYGIWMINYYYRKVEYMCPQCHETFRPSKKEFIFSKHALTLRRLTCTCCGQKGFCIETIGKENVKHE